MSYHTDVAKKLKFGTHVRIILQSMQSFNFLKKKIIRPDCGTGYRCPIKMKLFQCHFLADWQLSWASAPQKFEEWFLVTT